MARRRRDSSTWVVLVLLLITIGVLLRLQKGGLLTSSNTSDEEENGGEQGGACGTERWAVKTMADPEAVAVDLARPVDTTVEALTELAAPRWSEHRRRSAPEKTVWRVHGEVTAVKLEEDSDFHIVLRGSSGQTMVIEIPSPQCDVGSRAAAQIADVRASFHDQFKRWLGPRHGFHDIRPPQPVVVTGVGFFDKIHGQRGVAPNGIELHPLLSIQRE